MKTQKLISLLTATAICCGIATASGSVLRTDSPLSASAAESALYSCGFESGAADWEGRGGATADKSSDASFAGSNSLYVSGRTDSWNGTQMALNTTTFAPGSKFSFSAAVRPEGKGSTTMMLSLQYSSGDETVYDHIATADVNYQKWGVLYSAEYTIPSGASDAVLYVETESGSSSFYLDEVMIGTPGTLIAPIPSKGSDIVGDIDGNGKIDILDGVLMKSYAMYGNLSAPDSADTDGNLAIEANDALLMTEQLLGLRSTFPERQTPPTPPPSNFDYITNMQHHQFPNDYTSKCQQSGQIVKINYTSSNNGQGTNANVYLPYGYDQNDTSKKYNVFYLMHGGGENQNTLFYTDVYFGEILDHMIMNGDMEPLIVVTPTFENGGVDKFWNELVNDLIPAVEGKYNTYLTSTSKDSIKASRYHRAFGGFSMGGVTTWHCFLNILDYVAYYMPLSGDCWVGNSAQEKAANVANAAKKSGYKPDEYFVFCATGQDDIAYPNIAPQVEAMKNYPEQFIYTSDLSKGNFYFLVSHASNSTHWWGNVRHYIYDILPSFFHEHQND